MLFAAVTTELDPEVTFGKLEELAASANPAWPAISAASACIDGIASMIAVRSPAAALTSEAAFAAAAFAIAASRISFRLDAFVITLLISLDELTVIPPP